MLSPDRADTGAAPAPVFDVVKRPHHYFAANGLEARHVISDWDLAFNLGNAVKYILRAGRKGPALQDLAKAAQYLRFVGHDLADGRTLLEWRSCRPQRLTAEEVAIAFDLSTPLTIALGAIRSLAKSPTLNEMWISMAMREVDVAIRDLNRAAAVAVPAPALATA